MLVNINPDAIKIKLFILEFILLGALIGCKQKSNTFINPQNLLVHFKENLSIGGKHKRKKAYLFSSPTKIRTDKSGDIYVSDHKSSILRVFNSEGKYLRSIGEKGKGPGEFIDISDFLITRDNKLIVFDGSNKRITRFADTGKIISTETPPETMIWPVHSFQLDNNHFLILRKLSIQKDNSKTPKKRRSNFLHLFTNSFNKSITSFGNADSLINTSGKFAQFYTVNINPGHLCYKKNEIWYVPGIYDGRIFKFKKFADGWRLIKTLHGKIFPQNPVTQVNSQSSLNGVMTFTVFTGGGPYSGRVNSESLGLFKLNNGKLLHVSSQIIGKEREIIIQTFDKQGNLKIVGRVKELKSKIARSLFVGPMWMDKNERFYFVDKRNIPSIRVGRIKGI